MTSTRLDLPAAVADGHLAQLNAKFSAGDANALFRAIAFCGNQQIAMPEWVVAGFFAAMNRWWSLQCKTLDEAFGVMWPKGAQLHAARKKFRLELAVLNDVRSRHAQKAVQAMDEFLRVAVLRIEIGLCKRDDYDEVLAEAKVDRKASKGLARHG